MLKKSTIQLLRFHFSFFLLPVFLFALSETGSIELDRALLIFFILHFLLFPSSNGYNSYMDKDTGSIGGLEKPMQPSQELFWVTVVMDGLSLILATFVSWYFFAAVFLFIMASRAYSYRGIRLKKYPVLGYLTVVLFQGALTFFMVMHGSSTEQSLSTPPLLLIASSLLIGGFYPLTQVYQHEMDKKDGVTTLSYVLGIKGTFYFTAIMYTLALLVLAFHYFLTLQQQYFYILQLFMLPVLAYFFSWFKKVRVDPLSANFNNTMRMNWIASLFTNLGFCTVFILKYAE